MNDWFRSMNEAWSILMETAPRPLDRTVAINDARYLHYEGGGLPSLPELAERWGWFSKSGKPSVKRVRLLLKDESWRDPYQDARRPEKGTKRAREGQAKGTPRAGEGQAENDSTPETEEEGAGEGHAEGTPRARRGHEKGNTRVDPPSPSPSPSQSERESPLQGRGAEPPPATPPPSRGPFTVAWVQQWQLRHHAEPVLEAGTAGPLLRRWHVALDGDVDAFRAAVGAFWLAVDRRQAWRGHPAPGLREFTEDLPRWASAGRAALAAQRAPSQPPPSQPSPPRPPPSATPDAVQAWEQLVEGFRERLGHQDSDIWVEKPGHPVRLADGILVVELANRHYATWWLDQGFPLIAEQLGQPVRLLVDGVEPDLAEAS